MKIGIISDVHSNIDSLEKVFKKFNNEENAKPMTEEQIATHVWNHSRLNSEQIEFIRNLKNNDYIERVRK